MGCCKQGISPCCPRRVEDEHIAVAEPEHPLAARHLVTLVHALGLGFGLGLGLKIRVRARLGIGVWFEIRVRVRVRARVRVRVRVALAPAPPTQRSCTRCTGHGSRGSAAPGWAPPCSPRSACTAGRSHKWAASVARPVVRRSRTLHAVTRAPPSRTYLVMESGLGLESGVGFRVLGGAARQRRGIWSGGRG